MIRLVTDENFNGLVVRGVRRRDPSVDLVTVVGAGMSGITDPDLLEWAAGEGRIVLTHDAQTMVGFARARVRAGRPMAGVALVQRPYKVADVIDDILLIVGASGPADWADQVRFVPIR